MPTYDYRCDENGHEFEIVQGFNDAPGASCPECGSASQRKISAAAIHFKGSGWYRKDNAAAARSSNGSKSESESDSKSDSKDKKKSDKKSDSKSSSDSGSKSSSGSSGSKTHSHGGSTHSH